MAVKYYKPTTPGRRHAKVVDTSHLDKKRPEKSLISVVKEKAGRGNQGKITVRHKGGRVKRFYRQIDFKRDKFDVPGKVLALEYDPNRSAHIALLEYDDSERRYILAPEGLAKGDVVISSRINSVEIKVGNVTSLKNIPVGMSVHNIELAPGKGGQIARSAGLGAVMQAVEGAYAQVKMPSGEVRLIDKECLATVGIVGNPDHANIRLGKAGTKRHMGIRPTVLGKSMNPVDHPHGGGEGHQPIGLKYPKTPWGKHASGVRTRRHKPSDRLILQRRKSKRKK
jgi:large subunit ribosomal protein L2